MVFNRNTHISWRGMVVGGLVIGAYITLEFYQFKSQVAEELRTKQQLSLIKKQNLDTYAEVLKRLLIRSPPGADEKRRVLQISPSKVVEGPLPSIQSIVFYDHLSNQVVGRLGLMSNKGKTIDKANLLQNWKDTTPTKKYAYKVPLPQDGFGTLEFTITKMSDYAPLSSWQLFASFIESSFVRLFIAFAYIVGTLAIGFGIGFRKVVNLKTTYSMELKNTSRLRAREQKEFDAEKLELKSRVEIERTKSQILEDQICRYKEAAKQVLGINKIVEQLLSKEFAESKMGNEIRCIMSESSSTLRKAAQGLLTQNQLEVICIDDAVNQVLEEFKHTFKKAKTDVHIHTEHKVYFEIDAQLVKCVVRYILLDITDRLLKDHTIKIQLCDKAGTKIIFTDNGHILNSSAEFHPLDQVMKQVNVVGWKLTSIHEDGLTMTTLHIPNLANNNNDYNVIHIFNGSRNVK